MKRKTNSIIVSLLCLCLFLGISCKNDNAVVLFDNHIDNFNHDLDLFNKQKEAILLGVSTRTTAGDITPDELIMICERIDKLTFEFKNKYQDVFSKYLLPQLSEDSIALLLADEDVMENYITRNFSQEFVNYFYDCINNSMKIITRSSVSLENTALNPLEQVLVSDLHTALQIADLFPVSLERQIGYTDREKAERKCDQDHIRSVNKCNLFYFGSIVISFAGIGVSGGTLTAVGVAWAAASYVDCMVTADKNHRDCIKRIKE